MARKVVLFDRSIRPAPGAQFLLAFTFTFLSVAFCLFCAKIKFKHCPSFQLTQTSRQPDVIVFGFDPNPAGTADKKPRPFF